ncbi:hypothetical protein [Bosea sp. BIWAKO-01]|uniref:hypothetical protein n=1 Tax=Bosea sp. BIWAKO-01 TaxID=506668 RepID=UPI00114D1BE6|nr:hypothetical protein [Bosea sp. BIWAKO-01]
MTQSIRIVGTGVTPALDATTETQSSRGKGSWLHIAHNGKGIVVKPPTSFIYGAEISGIGTFRSQPSPKGRALFSPLDCDFDFEVVNASVLFDVFVANATKGIRLFNAGESNLRRVRGQPLTVGVQVDCAYDTIRFGDVHLWPWWSQAPGVRDYMLNSSTGVYLKRCDNPKFRNYFSIYRKYGLRIGHFQGDKGLPPGTTYKLEGHFEADIGIYGLYVDPETDGFTATLSNPLIQSTIARQETPTIPIFVKGSNARIDIDQAALTNAGANAVRVEGSNSIVSISHARVEHWDRAKVGHAAFAVTDGAAKSGSKIRIGAGDYQGESPVFGAGVGATEAVVPLADSPSALRGLTIEAPDDSRLTFRLRGRDNKVRSGSLKLEL